MNMHPRQRERGMVLALLIVVLLLFAILATMHGTLLATMARTSLAWDQYRQGATDAWRMELCVAETLQHQQGVYVGKTGIPGLQADLTAQLSQLTAGSVSYTVTSVPTVSAWDAQFPTMGYSPASYVALSPTQLAMLNPELRDLVGSRAIFSPSLDFPITQHRKTLDVDRDYSYVVHAWIVQVPVTRYAIQAYEFPSDVARTGQSLISTAPRSAAPVGLAPGRDVAFQSGMQDTNSSMPYSYRHRTVAAAAFQSIFSQAYLNTCSIAAGITAYWPVDGGPGSQPTMAGVAKTANGADVDLGLLGPGSFGTYNDTRSHAVFYSGTGGEVLSIRDSVGDASAPPFMLVISGPADRAQGPLIVNFAGSLVRPVVIIGYNIQVAAGSAVSINGALILDPSSSLPAGVGPITVGHLSYYAGSTSVFASSVQSSGSMPLAAEPLAPRINYVVTSSQRL